MGVVFLEGSTQLSNLHISEKYKARPQAHITSYQERRSCADIDLYMTSPFEHGAFV